MLRVGILGFGRIGREHAGWIASSGAATVAAVYDPTPARAAMAASAGLRLSASREALLADAAVDAVLVATPTAMHEADATAAIAAGKHVMVEKPLATTHAGALRIAGAATARGRVASVFHNRRWDADFLTVRSAVEAGVVGELRNVESRLGQYASCVGPAAPEYRPGWRNEAAFGGGALFDWGSHFVDQVLQLLMPRNPLRVFAQLRATTWSREADDFARVLIDFAGGVTGLVEINTTTTRPQQRWLIDGTQGSLGGGFSPTYDTREWARLESTSVAGAKAPVPIAAGGLSEAEIWRQFADACRGRGEPAVTIESVLPTMQVLDAAIRSSASGEAVTLGVSG